MANEKMFKTKQEVKDDARNNDYKFVTYPEDFDMDNPYQRVITAQESEKILAKQHAVIDYPNGEYYKFLDNLNVGGSIKESFNDIFYDKPLFILAIKSGANINFDTLKRALEKCDGNYQQQENIVNHFCAQLTMASFDGVIRDLYTGFIVVQDGKESKHSNSKNIYENFYKPMMDKVRFEIDTRPGNMPQIINQLYSQAKILARNLTRENADQVYFNTCKLMTQ